MIRAVLFDLDGTLYRQPPLRLLMAGELGTAPWFRQAPWQVPKLWRMLSAFRHVREELREIGRPDEPLVSLQYTRAAERAGVSAAELQAAVEEWIYRRPLKYLPRVARTGTADVLGHLTDRGLAVGVFSDYPVSEKLEALGLRERVTLELDATADTINAFKPHPRGFEVACERWALDPADVLYVGDRADVDAEGASRAGMPCAIVGASAGDGQPQWAFTALRDIRDLPGHIDRHGGMP